MKIKQISVFLENKTGRINQMCHALSSANINMSAFSLAESAEFGIMRIIVSDVDSAVATLKANSFTCSITEVVCVDITDNSGALNSILDVLAENNIFIEYMYAFSQNSFAKVIIRPSDIDGCLKVLANTDSKIVANSEFFQ